MKKLIPIIFLACCAQKPEVSPLQRIYQPRVLILAPKTEVKTSEGLYISGESFEIWHSGETVERLEKQLSEFK
jgi:hypothetical protein